jgi:hypothetical protein
MVREFTKAIPELIENIILAIPVLIEELANQLPVIFEKIAERADEIILALAKAMPKVAVALTVGLVSGIGRFTMELIRSAGRFVQELINALSGGIFGGDGGGVGGFFEGVGDALGFASGGKVPKGFPNDSLPARLSSDELVIDRSTTNKLEKFLNGQGGSGMTEALLLRIADLLEKPVFVKSETKINNSVLAHAILQLNRTQQRIS